MVISEPAWLNQIQGTKEQHCPNTVDSRNISVTTVKLQIEKDTSKCNNHNKSIPNVSVSILLILKERNKSPNLSHHEILQIGFLYSLYELVILHFHF